MIFRNSLFLTVFIYLISCEPGTADVVNHDDKDTLGVADSLHLIDTTGVQDTVVAPIDTIFAPPQNLDIIEGALHFYIFGDFGRNGEFGQLQLARMMDTVATILPPEFIVSVGDNFYSDGVKNTSDPLWQSSFEEIYPVESNLSCPWYLVLGNHDYHNNPEAQIAYTQLSQRWNMPGHYYHKDFSKGEMKLRMLFIDTNPFIDELYVQGKFKNKIVLQDTTKALNWMDSLLTDKVQNWRFVVGHHPLYAGSGHGGELRSMRAHIEPHLKSGGVDLYFNGHVHIIHHAKAEGPTHYFTCGTGSKTEPAYEVAQTIFTQEVTAFTLASVTQDSVYLQVVDYRGEIIYRTSVKKEQ